MRIDGHIHTFSAGFFPSEWFEAVAKRWTMASWPPRPAESIVGRIEDGMMDPIAEYLGEALDAASMDQALWMGLDPWVLLRPSDPGSGREHLQLQADLVRQAGGRVVGVAGIDPRRPEAADLVSSALDEYGMAGLKVYPPHGYYPHDHVCWPLYEACSSRDKVIVVHCAATQYPLMTHYSNPLYLQDVQYAFPSLTMVIAHAGYPMWWQEAAAVAGGHPSTYIEISHWDRLIDTDREKLLYILEYWKRNVGPHRILFGTDYFGGPRFKNRVVLIKRWAEFLNDCGVFNADELKLIMGDNAARIIPEFWSEPSIQVKRTVDGAVEGTA